MTYEETEKFLLDSRFIIEYDSENYTDFHFNFEDGGYIRVDVAKKRPFTTQIILYDKDRKVRRVIAFSKRRLTFEEANDALIKYLMEA